MFNIKRLSWKIALIVVAATFIVGASVAFYFEMRVISLIDKHGRLDLECQVGNTAAASEDLFTSMHYSVTGMRSLVEASFKPDEYRKDASGYFENYTDTHIGSFIELNVTRDSNIFAAYFAVQPDLAGYPLVNEIFYERTSAGVRKGESQTYDEYMRTDSDDMAWFYGAYDSSQPYWTRVHEFDGVVMVSYCEPVIIGGEKIGVIGVDIAIDEIIGVVTDVKVFSSGFAIIEDSYGELIESNDFARRLSVDDWAKFRNLAAANPETVIETELNGVSYMMAKAYLRNGYCIYVFAPIEEYRAEMIASLIRFAVIFPTAVIIVIFASILIGRTFSKPLVVLSEFMSKAGSTGDIALTQEYREIVNKYSRYRDEIGQTIAASVKFISRISDVSNALEIIATGDLSASLELLSERDVMGNSLQVMSRKLHDMFEDVNQSALQVSNASSQIADGAQSLAQGSMQQAASIEELSSLIIEVAEKTKTNTIVADKAAKLANEIKDSAEKGSVRMDDMVAAVNEISSASDSINKVIKVIDDIAFQTNILALNAAVEAARAGQHGKGFAVVAEEVRSLAAKSADAAKDTGALIENSIEKANLGVRIANETAESLAEIVNGINASNQLVSEISKSSEEQSMDIDQINEGIDHVSQIVQHNSATAEESAAASVEMNEQAALLQNLIAQFKLRAQDSIYRSLPS